MSIMAYNGGCVVAMKGKDCVAIATDHRFGIQVKFNKNCKIIKDQKCQLILILGSNHCNKFRESISS